VIFPLRILAEDPVQEPFCEAMNEALITTLAEIGALIVYQGISEASAGVGYSGKTEFALTGSCLLAGHRARITMRLIRAATGEHVWAKGYDEELKDIVAMLGRVARDVARHIEIRVTPSEQSRLARAEPLNPEAYRAYVEGRFWWNRRTVDTLH